MPIQVPAFLGQVPYKTGKGSLILQKKSVTEKSINANWKHVRSVPEVSCQYIDRSM